MSNIYWMNYLAQNISSALTWFYSVSVTEIQSVIWDHFSSASTFQGIIYS